MKDNEMSLIMGCIGQGSSPVGHVGRGQFRVTQRLSAQISNVLLNFSVNEF